MTADTLEKGDTLHQMSLAVWDIPTTPLTIDADAVVQIDARPLPEPDPDAVWTA